jgi:hypothetical protein
MVHGLLLAIDQACGCCGFSIPPKALQLSYYISYSDNDMVSGTSATTQSTWGDCSLAILPVQRKSNPEVKTSKKGRVLTVMNSDINNA